MKISKKVWIPLSFLGVLILALIIVYLLYAEALINSEQVHRYIQDELSTALKGSVQFQELETTIFPHPCLKFHMVRFTVPEIASGRVDLITLCPDLSRLLRGLIYIKTVILNGPDISTAPASEKAKTPFTISTIKDKVIPDLFSLSERAPDLKIQVEDGTLRVVQKRGELFFSKN